MALLALLAALCVCACAARAFPLGPPAGFEVVHAPAGSVRGLVYDDVKLFASIPYAEPPLAAKRFMAPVPQRAWQGIRNATQFQPSCIQNCHLPVGFCPNSTYLPPNTPAMSEDCLYLSVWAPRTASANSKLAVMHFFYGGGFTQGAANTPIYWSNYFANRTDIIIVVSEYRIGALGYLASSVASVPGNAGVQDQLMALKWTNANIAAFGGDASRITIVGESAGAMSVSLLLSMPKARGLFARAIMESNPITLPYKSLAEATPWGSSFAKHLRCGAADLACMQAAAPAAVLAAEKAASHLELKHLLNNALPWEPIVDGTYVTVAPLDAFRQGLIADVPLLWGYNQNEGNVFVAEATGAYLSRIEYDGIILIAFGVGTGVQKHFPGHAGNNFDVFAALVGDLLFDCGIAYVNELITRTGARRAPVYTYRFNHVLSFKNVWPPKLAPVCRNASCHGSELPYVFGSVRNFGFRFTAAERVLSDSMQLYWSNFIKSGDPNAGGARAPPLRWPKLATHAPAPHFNANRTQLVFQTPQNYVDTNYLNSKCAFLMPWIDKHY